MSYVALCSLGNDWKALHLYEEAADLGVWGAQENAAYILENLANSYCDQIEALPVSLVAQQPRDTVDIAHDVKNGVDTESSTEKSKNEENYFQTFSTSPSLKIAINGSEICSDTQGCCKHRLNGWANRRWAQLSAVGEPRAMRKTGEVLLAKKFDAYKDYDQIKEAHQRAAVLFTLAADQGDTESLMNLGWMMYEETAGMS